MVRANAREYRRSRNYSYCRVTPFLDPLHYALRFMLNLLVCTRCGKPLAEAKGEIGYAASFLEYYAEEGKRA